MCYYCTASFKWTSSGQLVNCILVTKTSGQTRQGVCVCVCVFKEKSECTCLLKRDGQKQEYPVLFWPKTDVPENNSTRECCWPCLIGQPPLSPVFGQKRPGTPGNSYFAQLPPVFGHFMFLSGGLLECSNRATWATRRPGDVEIYNFL